MSTAPTPESRSVAYYEKINDPEAASLPSQAEQERVQHEAAMQATRMDIPTKGVL